MKKRSLFICNTIYQILVAHWIQYHYIKDVPADIWITDHIPDGKEVSERVGKCDVFESSSFIESRDFLYEYWHCDSKRRRKIWYNSKSELKKFTKINNTYSELYIANFDAFTQLAYNSLAHSQKKLPKLILFEDGIGTYTGGIKEHYEAFQLPFSKIENFFCNKIFGCVPFYGNLEEAILFTPQDLQWNPGKVIQLEPINSSDKFFLEIINYIFGYIKSDVEYKRKYIFFEQPFNYEGKYIKDIELLEQLALKVGKDNIMVKLHPRSKRNCFKDHGFCVNSSIGVPWEVIALNMKDLSDKVFITVSSGSVFNTIRIFHKDVKMYSLQKIIAADDNAPSELKRNISERFLKLFARYPNNVIICDTIDQIQ